MGTHLFGSPICNILSYRHTSSRLVESTRLGKIIIVIDEIVILHDFAVIVIENFQKSIIVIEKFSAYFQLQLLFYSHR